MTADDTEQFIRDWYGPLTVEALIEKYGTTDAALRFRAVMVLNCGPRTVGCRDYLSRGGQKAHCRRKEVGL